MVSAGGPEAIGRAARAATTATFLFTDIEGSTVRWEAYPDEMAAALRAHDALVRATVDATGGRIFKSIGDAFCATFASVEAAARAAIAVQRGLRALDFSAVDGIGVRIAIHCGDAEARDGDFFGPALNRVARLLAIAHGGQIVLSHAAATLLRDALPEPGARLIDLGEQRLKDLTRPEHVRQLAVADLPAAFPPLRSLSVLPNNLPSYVGDFVGRERELGDLRDRLRTARTLTIVGAGGIGKTRCALQVAGDALVAYPHGVWLVELAALTDPHAVVRAVADALGVTASGDDRLEAAVVGYLAPRSLLLVLDNCEHVVDEAARAADTIVRACPHVRVLATSREPLGVAGEIVYRLPSLGLPVSATARTARDAMASEAVALFVARAQSFDAHFALTDENADIVADICRRVDGIALAIELAAARLRALSPRALRERLDERFRVLTGGSRNVLPRHQTMRALIDWSYDLLTPAERALFRTLAVFTDGFTLEAAETLAPERDAAFDVLARLVDKSLVTLDDDDGANRAPRYRMSETLRTYALDALDRTEGRDPTMARLGRWALTFVERQHARWEHAATAAWDADGRDELANLRGALAWTLGESRDVALGRRIVASSRRLWGRLAPSEGRRWLDEVSAIPDDGAAEERAALALARAHVHVALSDYATGFAAADRAVRDFERLGDERARCEAIGFRALASIMLGDVAEGRARLEDVRDAYERAGVPMLVAYTRNDLGFAYVCEGRNADALASYRSALAAFRAMRNAGAARSVASNIADLEFSLGNVDAALETIGAVLDETSPGERDAIYHLNYASYLAAVGRFEDGRLQAREGLRLAELGRRSFAVALALQHFATIAGSRTRADGTKARADVERAGALLGAADVRLETMHVTREANERRQYDELVRTLIAYDPDLYRAARLAGGTWDDARATAEALAV